MSRKPVSTSSFLVTTLGEIPDRAAAVRESYKALKPGGSLSITEIFSDPHYQSRSTVKRYAEEAGFLFRSVWGHWWFFTATFTKPASVVGGIDTSNATRAEAAREDGVSGCA
jgi:hypothetical protein